ncbi:MAG: regulatory protein RecX [Eubacterium sp.]|nr:regulatory protein RecX [Eubacterium sp.]
MNHLRIKKRNKSFQTFINDEYVGMLYRSDFEKIGIKMKTRDDQDSEELNLDITDDYLVRIMNVVRDRAFDKAVSYASVSECCAYDVRLKLQKKEFPEYAIAETIEMMYEYNYLNDERYAESYIRCYFQKKSRSLIKKELDMKNIKVDDIEHILDTVYEDEDMSEDDAIRSLLEKKFKDRDLSDEREKRRAMNLLVRHGFSFDKINNYLT